MQTRISLVKLHRFVARIHPIIGLFAVALVVTLAGCGSRGDEGAGGRRIVVATTTQVGDLAREVGGPRVDVRQILQPNSDPHDYEPRPSDARDAEQASVVLRSGGEVDDWLSGLLDAGGSNAEAVDLSGSVRARGDDPHWWQDPRNARRAVAAIRDALVEADPGGRRGYEKRTASYMRRLEKLDRSVASCIARIPPDQRKLVTSHDALGYYTSRYGLELVGAVIPSQSSQAQPSSKDIRSLVDQIRTQKVRAIFPESSLSPKLERAVSRESGAAVGGALWADTLGPRGSSGATYIESIQSNTCAIAAGVTAGRVRCRPVS